jgi:RNA polymerase I-specific transcription initiation factor RRN7
MEATTYQQVHRVLRLLNVNLGLLDEDIVRHSRKARKSINGVEKGEVTYERTRRNQDVFMPELSVVGAWVVVMKLAYGLDGRDRYVQRISLGLG